MANQNDEICDVTADEQCEATEKLPDRKPEQDVNGCCGHFVLA